MKALAESPLKAQTESPLHAFVANENSPIEFWRVGARGLSPQPAFCKYSCSQPSGDDLADVENYFNFVVGHTWRVSDGVSEYQQTDALDSGTLMATSANVDTNTYPPGVIGSPPIWNDGQGYTYVTPPDPSTFSSTSGDDWDKSGTRAGITAALALVDWAALWAGNTTTPNNFAYDRVQIGFDQSGALPFGGTASGDLISSFVDFGPTKILTGTVGDLGIPGRDAQSVSDGLGVSLSRSQIQIRQFHGAPIPYFIYEQADGAGKATIVNAPFPTNTIRVDSSIVLGDTVTYYRKLSEGVWDHDRQIIQLPDAAMDGPQHVSGPLGAKVRNGTIVSMVVGMTFEDWMAANLGPSWANYVMS